MHQFQGNLVGSLKWCQTALDRTEETRRTDSLSMVVSIFLTSLFIYNCRVPKTTGTVENRKSTFGHEEEVGSPWRL